jgi:hypothetical protein
MENWNISARHHLNGMPISRGYSRLWENCIPGPSARQPGRGGGLALADLAPDHSTLVALSECADPAGSRRFRRPAGVAGTDSHGRKGHPNQR